MSVEKTPQMVTNGASNAKGGGAVKGGHGAQGAGETGGPNGGFGELLASLGANDTEPVAAIGVGGKTPEDQSFVDASNAGNPFAPIFATIQPLALSTMGPDITSLEGGAVQSARDPSAVIKSLAAVTNTVQATALVANAGGPDELESGFVQNILMQLTDAPCVNGGGSLEKNVVSAGVVAGVKSTSLPLGQADRREVLDPRAPEDLVAKATRLPKERGRVESASPAAVQASPVIAGDSGKFELRVVGEKAEVLGRVFTQVAAEVFPIEGGPQTEFRRERAIFKINSTTAVPDAGAVNTADARPTSLSLEGMASELGTGMAQSDQNPGAYWMSSDLKTAEMKLEGFGDSPVEVSISVHGKQTHVAFRTDEVQTRLALEDAGAALKDMLSKEGLDLTGVSVGTTGAGGDRAQDHRPRQENRPTRRDNLAGKFPSETSGVIMASRTGQLDIFV